MKKNLVNNLYPDQDVCVFEDYHIFDNMDSLNEYPADIINSDFWKLLLKDVFYSDSRFHRDLLSRTRGEEHKKWADFLKIPVIELVETLREFEGIEIDRNLENSYIYKEKAKSPFNIALFQGVTPEALNKEPKIYNIQDAHSLYTELAKLDVFDSKSLIRFSKHFGIPYGIFEDIDFKFPINPDTIVFTFASIPLINKKIGIYKKVFEWFKLIKTNDLDRLRTLYSDQFGINDIDDDTLLTFSYEHLMGLLEDDDAFNIQIYPKYINGTVKYKMTFYDLFRFAYFQLSEALSNDTEFRECEYCGHIFEVSHQRLRFCPALPHRKRSSCEMAFNNRLKKKKNMEGEL